MAGKAQRHLTWAGLIGGLLAAIIAAGSGGDVAHAGGQLRLEQLQSEYRQSFPRVGHMLPDELQTLLAAQRDDVMVLDVREPYEYAVSHIPGAERIDPSSWPSAIVQRLGPRAAGKTVVLYCSVGYRSSKLATAIRDELLIRGARRVTNLMGGIFAWHNTGRGLVSGTGQTAWVHPYSRAWASYLDFDNLARLDAQRRAAQQGR